VTRVAVVTNPVCDPGHRALHRVRTVCRERGWPAPLALDTTPERPGAAQAHAAAEVGVDLVVAVGGDGTVREVASALAGSPVELGLVARGTANLLARNLRLPLHSLTRGVGVALDGVARPLDLVTVRLHHGTGEPVETTCLVISGLGHDGATLAAVRPRLKRHLGWPAYLEPGLWRLRAPLLPLVVAVDDDPPQTLRAWTVLVGSCGRIPFGVQVLPGARPDDGMLGTAVVAPRRPAQWGWVVARTALRLRRDLPGLVSRPGRAVHLHSEAPLTAQVDGDLFPGVTGLVATVRPAALRVRRVR
jgi:diacylglycerol kinase (ATP)